MPEFNFVLLHVQDHRASAALYSELLSIPVVDQKPDISILPLRDGVMLGLWARHTVAPASSGSSGAGEIAVAVADPDAVDALHADWAARDVAILQPPTVMSFGRTFTAADPDGHRLRVFAPVAA
jgi:predicted enzyme related to lactoylglutathione lyase